VNDYAENILAQQISQITGVAYVNIGGQQRPSVRVQLDPEKAGDAWRYAGRRAASSSALTTADAAKGHAERRERKASTIAANDQITKPEDYDNIILAYRQGAPIRVSRCWARPVAGPEKQSACCMVRGKALRASCCFQTTGRECHRKPWIAIKAALPKLSNVIPAGVKLDMISDPDCDDPRNQYRMSSSR